MRRNWSPNYYRQNVCVPSKLICSILGSKMVVVGGDQEDGALMDGIGALSKTHRAVLAVSAARLP